MHISEGPTFICVACNRNLHKSNVKRAKENDYLDIFLLVNTGIVSFDNQCYICLTCHKSLKKLSTPNILEKELICQQFKKIVIMPERQVPKLKGATVMVPLDVCETYKNCDVLMV